VLGLIGLFMAGMMHWTPVESMSLEHFGQRRESGIRLLSFVGPADLGGFLCNRAALLGGHGSESALASDLATATAHSSHDAGDVRGRDFRWMYFAVLGSS
jgi:hypothetical protein